MQWQLEAFKRVLGEHVSRDLADRLPQALAAVRQRRGPAPGAGDGVTIAAGEIGEALVEGLAPADSARISGLPLARVDLTIDGATVSLGPEDAHRHPLLASWLPDSLADAVGLPIIESATMAGYAPGRPRRGTIWIVERGDQGPRGGVTFQIEVINRAAHVQLYFGPVDRDGPMIRYIQLDASALIGAGLALARRDHSGAAATKPNGLNLDAEIPEGVIRH